MKFILLTIPHTGTKFTEHLLWHYGYRSYALEDNPKYDKVILGGHLGTDERFNVARKRLDETGFPLVCTLRHPYRVEKSWRGRNKRKGYNLKNGFMQLQRLADEYNPVVLAVDSPVREFCLNNLSELLGEDLKTNWKPRNNQQNTQELDPKDINPSPEIAELFENLPIMRQYYEH